MRDEIIPLNDEVFGLQMQTFQYVADKKYCSPLGEYTDSSLNRKKWIARERDRVNGKLNDPNYATTTAKIREAREEIEQRFVRELLPRYLSFIVKRNLKTIENFIDQFKGFKKIEKKVNGYDPRVLLAERSR